MALGQRDEARADASACSDATDDLRDLADKRKAEAETARAAAKTVYVTRSKRADAILSKPASVPGDDCRSAADRAAAWLATRGTP